MKIDCATKFRFYPTPEQEVLLSKTFGCVRFVWNAVLVAREEAWEDFGIATSFPDASALLTDLKNDPDLAFLGEVSSVPFQQALRHQQRAYDNFFSGRVGKPRFKRKDDSQSAWHCPRKPGISKVLKERMRGQSPEVRKIAWEDQKSLFHRYHRLATQGKQSTVAVTAVARELAGIVWAIRCHVMGKKVSIPQEIEQEMTA